MKYLILILSLFMSYNCFATEIKDVPDTTKPIIAYMAFDFANNPYKKGIGWSGLHFRGRSLGIGLAFTRGNSPMDVEQDNSGKNPKEGFYHNNIGGFYVDGQYHIDIKKYFLSAFLSLGYARYDGRQFVSVGYVDSYPQKVQDIKSELTYGIGVNFFPFDHFTLGARWNNINKISVHIGYVFQKFNK